LEFRDRVARGPRQPGPRSALVKELLRVSPRPTAVFAGDDLLAIGLIDALEARGVKVPRDVSVVGFDDIAFAGVRRIALTTVRQPSLEIGRLGAHVLIEQLEERDTRPLASVHKVLEPELVIRATTGPPPG